MNIGDIVRLKSGGPLMTVTAFGKPVTVRASGMAASPPDPDYVQTAWFDATGENKVGTFHAATLESVDS